MSQRKKTDIIVSKSFI